MADVDAVTRVSPTRGAADMGLSVGRRDSVPLSDRRLRRHDPPGQGRDPHQRVPGQHEAAAKLPHHGRPHHTFKGCQPLAKQLHI